MSFIKVQSSQNPFKPNSLANSHKSCNVSVYISIASKKSVSIILRAIILSKFSDKSSLFSIILSDKIASCGCLLEADFAEIFFFIII